jgi:hypothetical protein
MGNIIGKNEANAMLVEGVEGIESIVGALCSL